MMPKAMFTTATPTKNKRQNDFPMIATMATMEKITMKPLLLHHRETTARRKAECQPSLGRGSIS